MKKARRIPMGVDSTKELHAAAPDNIEQSTISKVMRRVIPIMMVCYFVAYLDRINVGMAAITMNKSLGLSPLVYGAGASIFFLGYFLFEVPSNLMMQKFGARMWIARIMITWGLVSGAMAFVVGPNSFYSLRFLLGVAEAGFFPGLVLYFSWWFPAAYRARMTGAFMVALPISSVIGAPLSGLLLGLDGVMGLEGWQWLFILEAAPAVVLGFVVLVYLTDRPIEAAWLLPAEREWLAKRMDGERCEGERKDFISIAKAFFSLRIGICDPRADIVTGNKVSFVVERLYQCVESLCGSFCVVTVRGLIGITLARQINSHHSKAICK
jgi:ACS family tartrate transporter-like MFS transporter